MNSFLQSKAEDLKSFIQSEQKDMRIDQRTAIEINRVIDEIMELDLKEHDF